MRECLTHKSHDFQYSGTRGWHANISQWLLRSWELPSVPSVPSFQCFRYKSLIGRYHVTGVVSVRSKMWVWEPGAALSRSALHDIAQCTNMEHTDSHFQQGKSALNFPKQGVSHVRKMHICRSKSKLEMNIKEYTDIHILLIWLPVILHKLN